MTSGAAVHASPRVAVIATTVSATERELLRAELSSAGLAAEIVSDDALRPRGRYAELAELRSDLERTVAHAHEAFIATREAEARSACARAEARGHPWAGEPSIARLLAELALVAALCGDANGIARAAAYDPALELSASRWSPDLRERHRRAIQARAAGTRTTRIASEPPGARLFVDGVASGETPATVALSPGAHAAYWVRDGFAPLAAPLMAGDAVTVALAPLAPEERAAALAAALADNHLPDGDELARVAAHLEADAAIALLARADLVVARLAGPALERASTSSFAQPRMSALKRVASEAARVMLATCSGSHGPPERARAGAPLAIEVKAGRCLVRVLGSFRLKNGAWLDQSAPVERGAAHLAVPPSLLPSSSRPYLVEYYLRGLTARPSSVDLFASQSAPARVGVEPNLLPWYRKWWVWTAAAGSAGTIVAVTLLAVLRPPSKAYLVTSP